MMIPSDRLGLPVPEPLHVLLADDDPIFAALAHSSLARTSFSVHVAQDGVEALQLIEQFKFDIALIDLSMPRIDGFRLIAMIRATPRSQTMPIIVLSSINDPKAVEEAYALGADAFQSKPINWTLLPVHMRHVCRTSGRVASRGRRPAELSSAADAGRI